MPQQSSKKVKATTPAPSTKGGHKNVHTPEQKAQAPEKREQTSSAEVATRASISKPTEHEEAKKIVDSIESGPDQDVNTLSRQTTSLSMDEEPNPGDHIGLSDSSDGACSEQDTENKANVTSIPMHRYASDLISHQSTGFNSPSPRGLNVKRDVSIEPNIQLPRAKDAQEFLGVWTSNFESNMNAIVAKHHRQVAVQEHDGLPAHAGVLLHGPPDSGIGAREHPSPGRDIVVAGTSHTLIRRVELPSSASQTQPLQARRRRMKAFPEHLSDDEGVKPKEVPSPVYDLAKTDQSKTDQTALPDMEDKIKPTINKKHDLSSESSDVDKCRRKAETEKRNKRDGGKRHH